MLHAQTHPVANGLSTDHPIPNLPFIDDSHLPLTDPLALEALGRHQGQDMWGRTDPCRESGGWIAFTTDPTEHDFAWVVRWHPDHGRSVVLYRDSDSSDVHATLTQNPALLFRQGTYWWDGTTWFRPGQIFDLTTETYVRRAVPAATTITAANLLTTGGDATAGRILDIDQITESTTKTSPSRWLDDLAAWAQCRKSVSLADCVVDLSAPELAADQLVSVTAMASYAEIAASTLRAYISRGQGQVPHPQATVANRDFWSRPVAEDWAEARRRSDEGLTNAMSTGQIRSSSASPGKAHLFERFSGRFFTSLWENPSTRKRWALRWRSQDSVREVAQDLAWDVAYDLDKALPLTSFAITIKYAILDEIATGRQLDKDLGRSDDHIGFYGIHHDVACSLAWLICHNPSLARGMVADMVLDAKSRFGVTNDVLRWTLLTALGLDSQIDSEATRTFLDLIFVTDQLTESNK
jgi:hypothetical protein